MRKTERTPPPECPAPKSTNTQSHTESDSSTVDKPELSRKVTTRSKRLRMESSPQTTDGEQTYFNEFKKELMLMLSTWKDEQSVTLSKLVSDVAALKSQCSEIQKSNSEIEASITFMNSQFEEMKDRIARLEIEKNQNRDTEEKQLEELQQHSRPSSIEVRSVPEKDKETENDFVHIIQTLGTTLGVGFQEHNIRDPDQETAGDRQNMEEFLGKEYQMVSEENFEAYLQHLGLGYLKRKIAVNVRPVQCLTRTESGAYKFTVKSALFTWDMEFEPGVLFDGAKLDGEKIKTLITFEGNIMTHKQFYSRGINSVHVIEFSSEETITTSTVEGTDTIAKRVYKLVK